MEELKKLLEESSDKFSIFEDKSTLLKYKITVGNLLYLIGEFLDDTQKAKVIELELFSKFTPRTKFQIVELISDDNIKLKILENSDYLLEVESYQITEMVGSMGEAYRIEILKNSEILIKYNIKKHEIDGIIKTLDDKSKEELLGDKELIEQKLQLKDCQILDIVCTFNEEETKLQLAADYNFEKDQMESVIKTFSDESKVKVLSENNYDFTKINMINIIATLSEDALVDFFINNREFLEKNEIRPYEITRMLQGEKQLAFALRIEETGLSINEKRQILATLREETKSNIDTSNFPPEYITALEIKFKYLKLDLTDINGDLDKYYGMDELIMVKPTETSNEDREKLLKLCKICPQLKIKDDLNMGSSTTEEYINAETWIESVLQEMDENWTDIQKVAFIDNAIGKKISYSPDFDTEVYDVWASKALWKIIDSGYGVCNGIAQVEQYILRRVGIEAEMVSGVRHAFLKLKNIELPNPDGGVVTGNTILDPTWNLTAQRYGAVPNNFCKSYEEIRKHDIEDDGTDAKCHENDEELSDATLDLDRESLRKVFTSIGLADKDGNFLIKTLSSKAEFIDEYFLQPEESIKKQLLLLSKSCPEFAVCQSATSTVLKEIVLNQENLEFNKCVVNRVYARDDMGKRPVLYVYIELPEAGKKFYFADKDTSQFIELSQKEFESKFECYDRDMEKQAGHRPWEDAEPLKESEELNRSSGTIVAEEGDGR